jgi:4-hydroxy-2-oxoheptanedioate aldolase
LIALAGFDFLVCDTEHGFHNPESVERVVRAGDASRLPVVVRVPSCQASAEAGRALDAGAAGTLFPRADGVASARCAIDCVKYAPAGRRGLGGVRANDYGAVPLDRFVLDANASTCVFVQIETAGALNAVAEIAAEKDLDMLFVGPNDLTQALGVPGQYENPRYRSAVEQVAQSARASGKGAGIMLRRPEEVPALAALGYRVFTTSDRALVSQSAGSWRHAVAKS